PFRASPPENPVGMGLWGYGSVGVVRTPIPPHSHTPIPPHRDTLSRGRAALESEMSASGNAGTNPRSHPRIGVPELAGVCTYAEAAGGGLGIEENVALLKRYNWVETRLTDLFLTRLTSTPEW